MKILFHTLAFLREQTGGSIEYNRNIVRYWPENEVTILTGSPETSNFDRADGPARVIGKTFLWDRADGLPRLRLVLRLLKSILTIGRMAPHYDWVVAEMFPTGLSGAVARRLLGVKLCIIVHGEELSNALAGRTPVRNIVYRWICRSADVLVASSENTKKLAEAFGARTDRVHVITPGVSDECLAASRSMNDGKQQVGLEGKTVLLTVARLLKRKGHAKVLRVLNNVVRSVPDLFYVIVGDDFGEAESLERQVAELGLASSVRFVGKVEKGELFRYYAACDCFIMASYLDGDVTDVEGFGIVYLEAGAFAKPVIGGRSGGVSEVIVDGITGIVVDATDAEQVERSIRRVLGNADYGRRLGAAAQKRVIASFRWRSRSEKMRRILERHLRDST